LLRFQNRIVKKSKTDWQVKKTMENPLKETKQKKTWLKIVSNKYLLISLLFSIWMIFLDNYSYMDQRQLNKQIEELQDNKKYYQEEIKKDKQSIKLLKNEDQVEKYAREKYYMKRENEDIYIIEYEGDTIKK
jgi:cell division protein DivIC